MPLARSASIAGRRWIAAISSWRAMSPSVHVVYGARTHATTSSSFSRLLTWAATSCATGSDGTTAAIAAHFTTVGLECQDPMLGGPSQSCIIIGNAMSRGSDAEATLGFLRTLWRLDHALN